IDSLQIDEVIRFLRVLERELRGTAPAVGLRPKVSNLRDSATEKSRHGGGNLLRGHAVDGNMPLIAPRDRRLALHENDGDQRQADQPPSRPPSFHFTMQNSATPLASNQKAKCIESCRNRGLPIVCWMTPKLP